MNDFRIGRVVVGAKAAKHTLHQCGIKTIEKVQSVGHGKSPRYEIKGFINLRKACSKNLWLTCF